MSVNQPGDVAYGFSQALIGVPNKPILAQRSPSTNDKAQIGITWINQASNEVFFLTSIVDNVATWVQAANGAGLVSQVDADIGSALPVGGIINAFGGANINTSAAGNTLTINLNDNVDLPATNAAGTQGIYQIGGANFLFGYGPTNSFVGGSAGNTSLTVLSSVRNVGVGNNALNSLTTGANNTAIGAEALTVADTALNNVAVGYLSLTALTSGESNTALGNQSLQNLVTGEDNIAIGFASGSALDGAQSSNILIGSQGTIGDNNIIRIGTQGNGAGEQNSIFVAGISGVTVGGTPEFVMVDPATGELGTASASGSIDELLGDNGDTASGSQVVVTGGDNITTAGDNLSTLTISVSGTTDHSLLVGNTAGSIDSLGVATDGQLPIGSTGADPVLATLTAGTGINITNAAGSITIDCTATSGIDTLDGDTGNATGSTVTLSGGDNITTAGDNLSEITISVSGTTDHALQVGNASGSLASLGVGTTGQVLIGSTGADPAFDALGVDSGLTDHSVVLAHGNSAFTALGAATDGQLIIGSTGVDPVLATLTAGTGINITNAAGSITIDATGGSGITQIDGDVGTGATGATITFDAATNMGGTCSFLASGATVSLRVTTSDNNVAIGSNSGASFSAGIAQENVALGGATLNSLVSGFANVAIGHTSMRDGNGASYNTAVGNSSLSNVTSGDNNISIGVGSGGSYVSSESSNIVIGNAGTAAESNVIRIGTQGTGAGQQDSCFIAGIGGVTPGGTPEYVIIDPTTGELGSTSSGGGGGVTDIDGDIGTGATGSTITFDAATECGASWQFEATAAQVKLYNTDANFNVFIGGAAGNITLSGSGSVGVGYAVLPNLTTGFGCVAIGYNALLTNATSDQNIAVGYNALYNLASGTGSNTAIGDQALYDITTGTNNTALGAQAGSSYTASDSDNIAIGSDGNSGDNGVIRIGDPVNHVSCFIQGIAGVTVSNSAAVLIDTTSGELGTIASSRRYKENIEDMDQASARILELRPVTFNYKNDPTRELHYGLIAEEVDGTLPEIVTYNKDHAPETVRYHELPVLLLNELQKQHAIIADLSRRLERLETRGSYESKA